MIVLFTGIGSIRVDSIKKLTRVVGAPPMPGKWYYT